MKKTILLATLCALCTSVNAQNTKQQTQKREDTAISPHNAPRHRHENGATVPKADTGKGKLNKEKNAGNVPSPGK